VSKSCFYDVPECSRRLSREHVISASVLKAAFGDPIRNLVSAELLGDRQIADHQQVLKDVCTSCNSRLSTYDTAGTGFIAPLLDVCTADGLSLEFTKQTLGWLLKTHLNHFRLIRDGEAGKQYRVDKEIKQSLVALRLPPTKKFALFVEGIEGRPYLWNADDDRRVPWFSYKSIRFHGQEIVISEFRLKCVYTWLLFPRNDSYVDFDARVQSVISQVQSEFNLQPSKVSVEEALIEQRLTFPTVERFETFEKSIRLKSFSGPPRNL
jgi:hypothetical protein